MADQAVKTGNGRVKLAGMALAGLNWMNEIIYSSTCKTLMSRSLKTVLDIFLQWPTVLLRFCSSITALLCAHCFAICVDERGPMPYFLKDKIVKTNPMWHSSLTFQMLRFNPPPILEWLMRCLGFVESMNFWLNLLSGIYAKHTLLRTRNPHVVRLSCCYIERTWLSAPAIWRSELYA